MRKLTLLSLIVLLTGIVSQAQSIMPCGFDKLHQKLMRTDRTYENAVRDVDNRWIRYTALMATAKLTYTSSGYVYEVPMVMHIVHTGGAVGTKYNPDSLKIASMVEYLNESYAATGPFPDSLSGGCRIPLKFVLAKRTPAGAPTNGIIRINGTTTYTNYDAFGVNLDSTKGVTDAQVKILSRWNPSDYYNVYVVNKIDEKDLYSTGGTAGYAVYPGSPTHDGMVVVASQVAAGSTTVSHEFGHAFSLRHTFEGDANGTACPPTGPCATTGDLVCDTEPHIRSASSPGWCPVGDANPCTGGASYKNVQHNIMDYTNCPPDRFTAGQRDRVMQVLNNERTGYKYSAGLLAPSGTVKAACIPTSTTTTGNFGPYIVDFNGMNVWTGDMSLENAAYIDHAYTQQSYAAKGDTVQISVSTRLNVQNVKVFIDYNNNGNFTDAGEEVFSHSGTTANEVHSGNIRIPSSVTTCTWLRMRVVAAWTSATIADYACGPYAGNAQAEDYAIYVKDRTAADTVTIAQTTGSNPSCAGETVTFTATPKAGTPTYRWFINGLPTTVTSNTYSSAVLHNDDVITCKIYYTGSCGADSSESNNIHLKVSATAGAVVKNSIKTGANPGCAGQSLVFKATVTAGGPAPKYSWKLNGTSVGSNVDTFAINTLVAGDKVWCIVTPNSGCSVTPVNSDTITISYASVVPAVSIALQTGTNPSCDSSSLTFAAVPVNGGAAPQYQWYVNNVAVAGATNINYTASTFKNNDSVWCRIISNHTCIVTGKGDTAWSAKIIVLRDSRTTPSLAVNISRGTNPGCLDELIEFTATVSDAGASPLVAWSINGSLSAYGTVFSSTTLADKDVLTCKMFVTPGSCNTVDSLAWGPVELKRSAKPATPVISLIGNLLVSSITTGIQWYGPSGLIAGATEPTYHPTAEGIYYAVVVNEGCNGNPSNKLNVALLTISPYNMSEVRIYPNPSSGIVTLDWGAGKMSGNIDVFTMTGQRVTNVVVENQSKQIIDLSALPNGNYFIVVRDSNGKTGTVSITVAH